MTSPAPPKETLFSPKGRPPRLKYTKSVRPPTPYLPLAHEEAVRNGKINLRLAVMVGNNHERAVSEEEVRKLGDVVAPGVEYVVFV